MDNTTFLTKNMEIIFGNKISKKKSRKQEMEQSKLEKISKNICSSHNVEHKCKGKIFWHTVFDTYF